MAKIDLDLIQVAVRPGGGSCLSTTTELAPAGGAHSAVAPAKFVDPRRNVSTFAYEKRFLDGVLRHTVILDSKQSQLNRAEAALAAAVQSGAGILGQLPHVRVTYGDGDAYTDLTLPHRVFDGHIRASSLNGTPTTQAEAYRAVRNATPLNARALLETSPATLVFGGWDASRKSRQGRWRSALVGEIVGFLAGDAMSEAHPEPSLRGGARVDPVGMQVRLDEKTLIGLAEGQKADLSAALYEKSVAEAKAAGKKNQPVSASRLGLGGIPPTLDQLGGVACDRIVRTHVLSFATLRQMRFGAGEDGDAACRAVLAALALNGLARSDAELFLRANCDLVEAGPTSVRIDQRYGEFLDLDPLGIGAADELLAAAVDRAREAVGLRWEGLTLDLVGNPTIIRGAIEAEEGGES